MFYHYDGLGSTRGLTDEDGNLTDTYDYEAFGEVLNQTGETENDYMFTGEQFDKNLNQYYLRARYYDQNVGRFTQLDTYQGRMGESATLHKYLYAHADPANLTDPTGNFGMSELGVTMNIVGTLTSMQTNNAFSTFDSLGIEDSSIDAARTATQFLALATLISSGPAIIKTLARKFSSLSKGARYNKVRNGLFGDISSVRPRSLNVTGQAIGRLTVNADNIASLAANVVYIYIVDESNNLVVAPRGDAKNGQKHTQLNGGGSAKAAGEIRVGANGNVAINNESGRYRSQNGSSVKRVKSMFRLMDVAAEVVHGAF